ncbi:MAG: response regulator [Syntrophaceae bacterium]|nr:response regulator [Syntrophaceae bacterium]
MIRKILIIDDSPVARKILKSCIPKEQDLEFFEAGDGLEGLSKFKEIAPDLTFLDITMPVMGGLECLEKIIRFDKDAKIVMCTADIQVKSLELALNLGALNIIKKPPSKESVEKIFSEILEKG